MIVLGWCPLLREGEGLVPDNDFQSKITFLFLLPFDAEAFKTCKNTIKLFSLCALPCLGVVEYMTTADCDCVL